MPHTEKWYEHTPQPVIESTKVTILWDFTIHTDSKIDANRPDITIKDHREKTCIMLDVVVPADKNISLKEFQKLCKYLQLFIDTYLSIFIYKYLLKITYLFAIIYSQLST